MRNPEIRPLTAAVRVFPFAPEAKHDRRSTISLLSPRGMLVIQTAGRGGSTQKFTTGTYRFVVDGKCLEEGLFYADDLPRRELQVLKDYVVRHNVDAASGDDQRLRLLSRLNHVYAEKEDALWYSIPDVAGLAAVFDVLRQTPRRLLPVNILHRLAQMRECASQENGPGTCTLVAACQRGNLLE